MSSIPAFNLLIGLITRLEYSVSMEKRHHTYFEVMDKIKLNSFYICESLGSIICKVLKPRLGLGMKLGSTGWERLH